MALYKTLRHVLFCTYPVHTPIRQHYHDFKTAPFVIRSKEKKGEGYSVKVGLRSLAMAS